MEDCSSGAYSSQATGENDRRPDTGNIEEAESSLRENGSLNFEVVSLNFLHFFLFPGLN